MGPVGLPNSSFRAFRAIAVPAHRPRCRQGHRRGRTSTATAAGYLLLFRDTLNDYLIEIGEPAVLRVPNLSNDFDYSPAEGIQVSPGYIARGLRGDASPYAHVDLRLAAAYTVATGDAQHGPA